MNKTTLSLCMIVKNEEKYIAKSIDSVKDIVNEIVIVDTGSTDSTLDILKNYNVKLYNYKWENDFASARNFAINKIKSDWILFLDADEILDEASKDNLINYVNTTKLDGCHFIVYNYRSENQNDFTIHYAFRLFRNNKGYYYKGKIHEQIFNDKYRNITSRFSNEEIILHHYGYSVEVLEKKDKRSRNIPILLEALKENPKDSFNLFNLGNEYLAQNDVNTALHHYELSYSNLDLTKHYSVHLLYRMAVCYQYIKKYDYAIRFVEEGLQRFSPNVDFEYLKGCLFLDTKRYTLAIDSFNNCLTLGDSGSTVKFVSNCGSINPLMSLGNLYYALSDYNKALDCYNKILNISSSDLSILYKIGSILNKKHDNKNEVTNNLLKYFASKDYIPNVILTSHILLKENLIHEVKALIESNEDFNEYKIDEYFLRGVISLYENKYNESLEYFNKAFIEIDISTNPTIIIGTLKSDISKYIFILSLLTNNNSIDKALSIINNNCSNLEYQVYLELKDIYLNNKCTMITENTQISLNILEEFLNNILGIKEYNLFQKLVEILNYVDDESVLITLSKVYEANGFKDLAIKEIFNSIKKFDFVDSWSTEILYKEIL
ncbi:TPR domain-containing glycosyltransferase [Clostridium sp.]|uniref:tetratricopeptide repeat-containing glycosyltransferase family 2 protein n=1 Tax=Clostridium sp. TaxID=1506 RepID=UPI001D428BB1|nr:TPR domain-containing glycosyltransferase [Clostridium sp.]MBS5937494.1 glycosyltransferase [Clostridium sp.]